MNRIFASVLIVASLIFATLGNSTYAQTVAKGTKIAASASTLRRTRSLTAATL